MSGPLELRAWLEPLPDAALGVVGEGALDLVHLDALRVVAALPEQAVDVDLGRGGRDFRGKNINWSLKKKSSTENTVRYVNWEEEVGCQEKKI